MLVVALDLSLTSSGWARAETSSAALPEVGTIEPRARGVPRLQECLTAVVGITKGAGLVLVEGYAFGMKQGAHQLGELGGVIRLGLHQMRKRWIEIPPACVKKLATGNGNAPKDQVLSQAIQRLAYQGFSKDEADALWLLQAALIHYDSPGAVKLPQKNLEYISKIEWPDLQLAAAS